uniref:Uncharacterized protein n=1 Tax=viral metagenome TaxID=1070528 RepID=A0A6M3LSB7_9ZZZZ
MSKWDIDLRVIERCTLWLRRSSSDRMLRANMDYLWDRFIEHRRDEDMKADTPHDAGRETT